jgi:hypothetical protein
MLSAPLLFAPQSSDALSPYMTLASTLVNDYGLNLSRTDDMTHVYTMGCITGSMSFAIAAQSGEFDSTLIQCKHALLARLGLMLEADGGGLSAEQTSQRGYICGLFESIEQALLVANQGGERA